MFYNNRGQEYLEGRDTARMNVDSLPDRDRSVAIMMNSGRFNNVERSESGQGSDMYVLCFNLGKLPRSAQFLICCFGVFCFYLIYGFFQELIFRLDGFRPFGMYLTLLQFAFYTLFSFTEKRFQAETKRRIPMKSYVIIAFLTVGTMGFSNTSVGYLNYPTQVIFKCCKLIPVLIMGIFIQGKRYGVIDVCACLCMSVGLIFFTLADSTTSPSFSLYGVVLILLGLCSDAVIGNYQEKVMKTYGCSNTEMVFYSYGLGFLIILAFEVFTGQLFSAFTFCLNYPMETYCYAFIFSLCGYLGVNFVLTLIKSVGALLAVTVTTCRKAFTIILSFILFSKPFTFQYIWSALIVLFGIYLNVYSKNKATIDKKLADLYFRTFARHSRIFENNMERVV